MLLVELFNNAQHTINFENDYEDIVTRTQLSDGTWLGISFQKTSFDKPEYDLVFVRAKSPNLGDASFDKNGMGNEIEVFSFVLACAQKFIQEYKPNMVHFSASGRDDLDPTNKRAKMYYAMAKRYTPPNYELNVSNFNELVDFEFTRKDVANEEF